MVELIVGAGIFIATATTLVYHVRRNGSRIAALEAKLDQGSDDSRRALAAAKAAGTTTTGLESRTQQLESAVASFIDRNNAQSEDNIPELAQQIAELSEAITANTRDSRQRESEHNTRLVVLEDELGEVNKRIDTALMRSGKMPDGAGL